MRFAALKCHSGKIAQIVDEYAVNLIVRVSIEIFLDRRTLIPAQAWSDDSDPDYVLNRVSLLVSQLISQLTDGLDSRGVSPPVLCQWEVPDPKQNV